MAINLGNTMLLKSILITLCATFSFNAFSIELNGLGGELPSPLFNLWATHYSSINPEIKILYKNATHEEAIKQITNGTVDFVETDTPLIKRELDKRGLSQFPYMFTAISPVVNIPGIFPGQLKLTGQILGDIFLGKIKYWDDIAIVNLNSSLILPTEKIIVASQASHQGGNYNFTNYLANSNQEWADKVGVGISLKWPTGVSFDNFNKLIEFVKNTPYSISYAEISQVKKLKLSYAKLLNQNGHYAFPNIGNVELPVKKIKWDASNGFNENVLDLPGVESWPIAVASYIVIKNVSDNSEQRKALIEFLTWSIMLGQYDVASLDFLPIDRKLFPSIKNIWNQTPLR